MNVDYNQHTVTADRRGVFSIDGFQSVNQNDCFCIVAQGARYHEHGIANNSLLYCCKTAEIFDKDLVVVFDGETPTIYQYREDNTITADGEKRILHDRTRIHAKVLGSFNFYH